MSGTSKERPRRPKGEHMPGGEWHELIQLKLELVAARERGEEGALGRALAAHPAYALPLSEFAAALRATGSYEHETPDAETMAIAERALGRAMAAVFPAAVSPVSVPAVANVREQAPVSLKALRRTRGLSLSAVARRLGLGLDVLSDLEAGLIVAASVPERLVRALGDLLETSADQVRTALIGQPMVRPALLRDRSQSAEVETREFADAIRLSPSMTPEQKSAWLTD